ncbi:MULTISPECIES: AfsR/SARP family transcriptional regulator [Anaerotruncus]|uniref:AfsR/SARP family transcriptional regulator n=1 Tax=Anaerotruncus TaxID=244127 RepID=UPI001362E233|nr:MULTISPECIES: BTAD domain-containing putative transcriptional regulator [Anaerotruncus]
MGNLKILYRGKDITTQLGSKACALIFLLMESKGKGLSREKIIAYLWPDSKEEAARYNLRYNLWEIKKIIKEDADGNLFLLSDNNACKINENYAYGCDFIEAACFDRKKEYTMAELLHFRSLFSGELYEGAFFKGCEELNNLILYRRIEFEKLKVQVMESMAELLAQEENYEGEIEVLQEILKIDPYNEEIAGLVMDAYCKIGKRAEAVNFYRTFSNTLAFSINIAPGEVLTEKYRQIQDGAQYEAFVRGERKVKDSAVVSTEERVCITCMEGIPYFWLSALLKDLKELHGDLLYKALNERDVFCLGSIQQEFWKSELAGRDSSTLKDVNIMNACVKALSAVASRRSLIIETRQGEYMDQASRAFVRYMKATAEEQGLKIVFFEK